MPDRPDCVNGFVMVPKELLRRRDLRSGTIRVYAAIADRIGANGCAWPGWRTISADAGVSVEAVRTAIGQIERTGILRVEHGTGPGGANIYRLPAADTPSGVGTERYETRSATDPVALRNPVRGALRIPVLNSTNSTRPNVNDGTRADAEAIYGEYPRKVKRVAALRAIEKALAALRRERPDAGEWLLERVQLYAAAVAQWPEDARQFIPYPSSWFSQERYNEDSREWYRNDRCRPAGNCRPSNGAAAVRERARRDYAETAPLPIRG